MTMNPPRSAARRLRTLPLCALLLLVVAAVTARAGDLFPFCIDFNGGPLVYQLPRPVIAQQPKWSMGEKLPVPLSKLCQIARDGAIDPKSPDAAGWKVEHVQFWRMRNPDNSYGLAEYDVSGKVPADLDDRWYCVVELSHYGDYTGDWYKNLKYGVVMLDGTYVPPTKPQS